jgi:hypothetical protein
MHMCVRAGLEYMGCLGIGGNDVGPFIFLRILYTSTFFIFINTILINIIFGVIIDTFGDLRERNQVALASLLSLSLSLSVSLSLSLCFPLALSVFPAFPHFLSLHLSLSLSLSLSLRLSLSLSSALAIARSLSLGDALSLLLR